MLDGPPQILLVLSTDVYHIDWSEAQNKRKLEELQRVLDTSGLEKLGQENQVYLDYRL